VLVKRGHGSEVWNGLGDSMLQCHRQHE
jgi:hypothetical protein